MILTLFPVFFLLFSTCSAEMAAGGNKIKMWLNTPENMNMLYSQSKGIINQLPPPRDIAELEKIVRRIGDEIEQKVELLKALAAGRHPAISKRLEGLGWGSGVSPDTDVLSRLLTAKSAPHLHVLLQKEGY